ncbi:MAG: FkbM family methyltransferase [Enterovirga sp.]|nr:FkbM family methyltransferase [Enterovirga sp.]
MSISSQLSHLSVLASRFFVTAHDWGLPAASGMVVRSKLGSGTWAVRLRGSPGPFWFRCGLDRSVLTQFGREFGIIDPRDGPPIRRIVDAGANIGVFSALARRLYPGAEILALEVEPENYALLVKNAEALGHITPVNAALWSETGRVSLILGDNPEAHAVTDRPEPGAQQVAATSLGDLLMTHGWDSIDILKMDIEGAEAAVIGSLGADLIGRINCIRVECNDTEAPGNFLDMAKGLLSADFDSYAFDENVYFIRRSTGWAFRRRYPGVADIPCYPA